MNTDKY